MRSRGPALATRSAVVAVAAIAGLALLLSLALAVSVWQGGPSGLRERDISATGGPRRIERLSIPATQTIHEALGGSDAGIVRIQWVGHILAERSGKHRLTVSSSGTCGVWIDRQLLVAATATRRAGIAVEVELAAGSHTILVDYNGDSGTDALNIRWARPGDLDRPLTELGHLLAPAREPRTSLPWRTHRKILTLAATTTWLVCLGTVLGMAGVALFRRCAPPPQSAAEHVRLAWLLLALVPLLAWGLDWDLHGWPVGWAPDEVASDRVFQGLQVRFAGSWQDYYPPLHYYLLSLPALVARAVADLAGDSVARPPLLTILAFAFRCVGVLSALGTLAAVFLLSREFLDARASHIAVLLSALAPTFVYYARTANVDMPSVFWLSWSLVFYARYVRAPSLPSMAALTAAMACGIGTKDQVAGFFALVPLALVAAKARAVAAERGSVSWYRVLVAPDWPVGFALAVVTLMTIYLWPVNPQGIGLHLDMLRAARYRPAFEASAAGYFAFAAFLLRQLAAAVSWPSLLLSGVGIAIAVRERRYRLLALLVPVLSYSLAFLGPVRYSFDRFLLGPWIVLSVFGALAAARAWPAGLRTASVRGVAGLCLLAVLVLTAASVNVAQRRDARYAAGAFLARHASPDATVGYVGVRAYYPRITSVPVPIAPSELGLGRAAPDFLVIVERHRARFERTVADRQTLAALEGGRLRYRRVFVADARLPWWALAQYDSWFQPATESGRTVFEKINPPVSIYQRVPEP